jgi:hypothetical protein
MMERSGRIRIGRDPRSDAPRPGSETSRPSAETPRQSAAVPRSDPRAADAWAQLWFSVERHPWSTIAVVPASPAEDSLSAARSLAGAGNTYREGGVALVDATRAQPSAIPGLVAAANEGVASGARVVIAVDSPLSNPAAIAIARAVDAALLAVPLGRSKIADARRTVETVGRDRFIGSIAIKGATTAAR